MTHLNLKANLGLTVSQKKLVAASTQVTCHDCHPE